MLNTDLTKHMSSHFTFRNLCGSFVCLGVDSNIRMMNRIIVYSQKKRYELDHLSRLSLDHIGHNLDLVQAWMVRDWWVQAELKTHSQSAAGLNRLRISIHRVPTMIFDFPSDPTSPATYVFESWNIIGSCWIIHHYVWYTQMKFYLVSLTTWYDAPTQVTIPLQIIFSALWDEEQLWLQNRLGGTKSILKWKKLVSKLSDEQPAHINQSPRWPSPLPTKTIARQPAAWTFKKVLKPASRRRRTGRHWLGLLGPK